jgi:prepilin-type N-terminal cleavage/methylation domain-containing protein
MQPQRPSRTERVRPSVPLGVGEALSRARAAAGRADASRSGARRAFTILELLVVISIASILTAILMPTLARVREAAERVQCASNLRQIGCALIDYGDDHRDRLPSLDVVQTTDLSAAPKFAEAMALTDQQGGGPDGLGRLLLGSSSGSYLSTPAVLYCPCHRGDHPFERYERALMKVGPREPGTPIYCNYHYRGTFDPVTRKHLPRPLPPETILVVDGLRTRSDFSHVDGTNRLKADCSVDWYADTANAIFRALPVAPPTETPPDLFSELWRLIDSGGRPRDDS